MSIRTAVRAMLVVSALMICEQLAGPSAFGQQSDQANPTTTPTPDPSLAKRFYGRVVDFEGKPVAGAKVYATYYTMFHGYYNGPDDIEPVKREWGTSTTDDDGRFDITGLFSDTIGVLAVHPERGIGTVDHAANPRGDRGPLEVQLAKPTFIEGKISGLPQTSDMHVYLSGRLFLYIHPQSDGRFRVGPLPGADGWHFGLDADGIDRVRVPVPCEYGKTATFSFDLLGPERLTGMVLGPDDKPLQGVQVALALNSKASADSSDDFQWQTTHADLTDAAGKFAIGGIAPGDYKLYANRHKVGPEHLIVDNDLHYETDVHIPPDSPEPMLIRIDRLEPKPGDMAPDLVVTTRSGDEFKLRDQRGKAILLQFADPNRAYNRLSPFKIESMRQKYADDGKFVALTVYKYSENSEQNAKPAPVDVTWSISDVVDMQANPSVRAFSSIGESTFLVGPDGRIAAKNFGDDKIEELLAGLLSQPGDERTALASKPLNLITGRVISAANQPVANASVFAVYSEKDSLYYQDIHFVFPQSKNPEDHYSSAAFESEDDDAWGEASAETRSDCTGRFAIKVTRTGRYSLLAAHPELGIGIGCIRKGVQTSGDLEIQLVTPTFLVGRIGSNAKSTALWGRLYPDANTSATLSCGSEGNDFTFMPRVTFKEDGTFRAGPLLRGGWWFLNVSQYVRDRGYSAELLEVPVSIRRGESNTYEIDLRQGANVAGRLIGPSNEPLAGASVAITRAPESGFYGVYGTVTNSNGEYAITGMPEGLYRLDAQRYLPRIGDG